MSKTFGKGESRDAIEAFVLCYAYLGRIFVRSFFCMRCRSTLRTYTYADVYTFSVSRLSRVPALKSFMTLRQLPVTATTATLS